MIQQEFTRFSTNLHNARTKGTGTDAPTYAGAFCNGTHPATGATSSRGLTLLRIARIARTDETN